MVIVFTIDLKRIVGSEAVHHEVAQSDQVQ